MGARFEYEGEEYVKTGPIFAAGKSGGQRLIPKYAVLRPLDEPPAAAGKRGREMGKAAMLAAFQGFYARCRELVPDEYQEKLEAARQEFMRALDA